MIPAKPTFKVFYIPVGGTSSDITQDISRYLIGVRYTDRVIGETDEIEIQLEDTDGLWRSGWYPGKRDRLKLQMGIETDILDCGEFVIDEIELSGPPDTVTIRAMAAWVTSAMRTHDSHAHENKTLKEIAQTVADKLGLVLEGTILTMRIARSTQNQETDLAYLARVSEEYGYAFNVRANKLIFTSIYELEAGLPVYSIDRTELKSYSIKDKTSGTYKSAKVRYNDPVSGKVVDGEVANDTSTDGDGQPFSETTSEDVLEIRTKAENKQQAEAKAKAALHKQNKKAKSGHLTIPGNPLFVAGNNFDLTGMGTLSGRYHIDVSTHSIDRSGGYTTDLEIRRVKAPAEKQKVTPEAKKPKPKPKPTTKPKPLVGIVDDYGVGFDRLY